MPVAPGPSRHRYSAGLPAGATAVQVGAPMVLNEAQVRSADLRVLLTSPGPLPRRRSARALRFRRLPVVQAVRPLLAGPVQIWGIEVAAVGDDGVLVVPTVGSTRLQRP